MRVTKSVHRLKCITPGILAHTGHVLDRNCTQHAQAYLKRGLAADLPRGLGKIKGAAEDRIGLVSVAIVV